MSDIQCFQDNFIMLTVGEEIDSGKKTNTAG
jgi:hypothetical protein